jgi:hypothetical protein
VVGLTLTTPVATTTDDVASTKSEPVTVG